MAGCRTPFARSGTVYRDMTAVDLGTAAVRELLERTEIDPAAVGMVVMGQVVPSVKAPNLGREVVLRTPLPRSVPAHTVNRACASANEAIVEVVSAILLGQVDAGIAGGAESLSDVPILHSKRMSRALVEAQKARSLGERLGIFARLRPRDLVPQAPAIAEPSTGLDDGPVRGEDGEGERHLAARAGRDRPRVAPATPRARRRRAGSGPRRRPCSCLPPTTPRSPPTTWSAATRRWRRSRRWRRPSTSATARVTAGNSSPLTDGGAAVLLMAEDNARAEGREPLAFVRSWATAAVDPGGQLLMGPALAIPKALERAGIELSDVDVIEMHEAFAAQVASNIQALESETWAREKLGRTRPVGSVDRGRLNVNGGSIAIGHPFGATGARITTTLANEMKRRDARLGLVSVCAQGGMGFAMVLER